MKQVLTLVFLCFISVINSQNIATSLAVSGKSSIEVKPDITVISIRISTINTDYKKATETLETKSQELKNILAKEGITAEHTKSENFEINKRYDYKNGSRVYMGYDANLHVQLEFYNDNAFANRITNTISTSTTEAEVNISFTLSEDKQNKTNDRLIEKAITDAKKKADIIAKTTDQKIIQISKINYGVRENMTTQPTMNYAMRMSEERTNKASETNFAITPRAITRSTEIIIYWTLEPNK